jgi:hypothetical protein
MAEIINGLNKIEQITLGETVFGNGLNERLEQIDDNFQSIITSEYLKGDSGVSFGYATFDSTEDPTDIYDIHDIPITYEMVMRELQNVIGKDIDDFSFTFIYEIINGKKIVKSSLPFIYYDPAIYGINQNLDQEDKSGVIIYDNGEFKKLNAFPTIYYNEEDDAFYWKINGIETKLAATGPKGERGFNSSANIVKFLPEIGKVNDQEVYIIDEFLYEDGENYVWLSTSDNKASEILKNNGPCLGIYKNESSNIEVIIGPVNIGVLDNDNIEIYYATKYASVNIETSLNLTNLDNLLSQISSHDTLKYLYVPGRTTRHILQSTQANDNIARLACIDKNGNNVPGSMIDIQYGTTHIKNLEADNITNTKFESIQFGNERGVIYNHGDMPLEEYFTTLLIEYNTNMEITMNNETKQYDLAYPMNPLRYTNRAGLTYYIPNFAISTYGWGLCAGGNFIVLHEDKETAWGKLRQLYNGEQLDGLFAYGINDVMEKNFTLNSRKEEASVKFSGITFDELVLKHHTNSTWVWNNAWGDKYETHYVNGLSLDDIITVYFDNDCAFYVGKIADYKTSKLHKIEYNGDDLNWPYVIDATAGDPQSIKVDNQDILNEYRSKISYIKINNDYWQSTSDEISTDYEILLGAKNISLSCKSFRINGDDILSYIKHLEDRIVTLESGGGFNINRAITEQINNNIELLNEVNDDIIEGIDQIEQYTNNEIKSE